MINPVVKSLTNRTAKNMYKILFVVSLLISAIACGGSSLPRLPQDDSSIASATPTPTPNPAPTLVSSQVFNNVPQAPWEFVSQCQNLNSDGSRGPVVTAHTYVQVTPVDSSHTIWHYTKDQSCAYWMPDGISAELYFFLEQDSTGAWYSTGGHIIAPYGFPWDATHAPQDFTYTLAIDPTRPRPYLIIPAMSNNTPIVMTTTFADTQGPNTPWTTTSLTVPASTAVYTGWAMQSHQIEGDCKPSCADEGWLLAANGMGMVQVTVYNTGSGPLAVPIVLKRVQ